MENQVKEQDGKRDLGNGVSGSPPNIIVIMVDELRYPTVPFPSGVHSPDDYVKQVMPETYKWIWEDGIKFSNYFTASDACSPARGTIITGLYNQQSWMLCTRPLESKDNPAESVEAPSLNRAYPTYGKLLQQQGYETPYIGKWHLSNFPPDVQDYETYLEAYGFDGLTIPDPVGQNGQGYTDDPDTATQAANWLSNRKKGQAPFCLTIGFINPHDKEYFWGGTEATQYNSLYGSANPPVNGPLIVYEQNDVESNPPSLGFPALPPNWESTDALKVKNLSTQMIQKFLFQNAFGTGISEDPKVTSFSLAPSGIAALKLANYPVAIAPHTYWARALDLYAQVTSLIDEQIGKVLQAIPREIRQNTVVILTSDHGEYGGAHGLQGKSGAIYEEAIRVPLVVRDFSGRFTRSPQKTRTQLASSVDFLNLLLGLACLGTTQWLTPELRQIYGKRLNLVPLLRNPDGSGRSYILHSTDEHIPSFLTGPRAPLHIVGLRTQNYKLGVYAAWERNTTHIVSETIELEYYDYSTLEGRLETKNLCNGKKCDEPAVDRRLKRLLQDLIPNELRAPLPGPLEQAQNLSRERYLRYVSILDEIKNNQDPRFNNVIVGTYGL